jgi:hypothetical protein
MDFFCDVLEMTRSPLVLASCVINSSVMLSARYSWAGFPERFSRGKTAMERILAARVAAGDSARRRKKIMVDNNKAKQTMKRIILKRRDRFPLSCKAGRLVVSIPLSTDSIVTPAYASGAAG